MNDNTIDSIEWHRNQLAKLLPEDDFGKLESELDSILEKAEKGRRTEFRRVRRGGTIFQQKYRVGRKVEDELNAEKYGREYRSWNEINVGEQVRTTHYDGTITDKLDGQCVYVRNDDNPTQSGKYHVRDIRSMADIQQEAAFLAEEAEHKLVGDEIEIGAYVDFGAYGDLYVVKDLGDRFWVTDIESDRHNSDAQGWYIKKSAAKKIIESGYSDDGDEEEELSPWDYQD